MSATKRYHEEVHAFQVLACKIFNHMESRQPGFWSLDLAEDDELFAAHRVRLTAELNRLEYYGQGWKGAGPYAAAFDECRKTANNLFPFWFEA